MDELTTNIYTEVYEELFPAESNNPYHERDWIFPHHIDVMLDLADKLCEEKGGNKAVCKPAIILHDTGLVYKRTKESPEGHETRSVEYADTLLSEKQVNEELKQEILACVEATEPKITPTTLNQEIVRTCDALAKFKSIHFLAKAHFYRTWDYYTKWLEEKIHKDYEKIAFEERQEEIQHIYDHLRNALSLFKEKEAQQPKHKL